MTAQAYTFVGHTFCERCAYVITVLPLVVLGHDKPADMDEAIAVMALAQIESGQDIDTPVAVAAHVEGNCENCGRYYGPVTAQSGGDAA